jgi:hypothetical protein
VPSHSTAFRELPAVRDIVAQYLGAPASVQSASLAAAAALSQSVRHGVHHPLWQSTRAFTGNGTTRPVPFQKEVPLNRVWTAEDDFRYTSGLVSLARHPADSGAHPPRAMVALLDHPSLDDLWHRFLRAAVCRS